MALLQKRQFTSLNLEVGPLNNQPVAPLLFGSKSFFIIYLQRQYECHYSPRQSHTKDSDVLVERQGDVQPGAVNMLLNSFGFKCGRTCRTDQLAGNIQITQHTKCGKDLPGICLKPRKAWCGNLNKSI